MDKEVLRMAAGISIVIGIILLAWGLLAKVLHWPDPVNGIFSGPITLGIGLIALLISKTGNKKS